MDWTTEWFNQRGDYIIWCEAIGLELVTYSGGNIWTMFGKPAGGGYSDTKENWIECKELNDPIYRILHPIRFPI